MALAILSSELPAASRMAAILVRHCRVCSWIVVPVIAPVAGSVGAVPERRRGPRLSRPGCRWLAVWRRLTWQRCDAACDSFEGRRSAPQAIGPRAQLHVLGARRAYHRPQRFSPRTPRQDQDVRRCRVVMGERRVPCSSDSPRTARSPRSRLTARPSPNPSSESVTTRRSTNFTLL